MTDQTHIRRRPDGSIDTAFYMAQGRQCRSAAAFGLGKSAGRSARAPVSILAVLAAFLPFLGHQG